MKYNIVITNKNTTVIVTCFMFCITQIVSAFQSQCPHYNGKLFLWVFVDSTYNVTLVLKVKQRTQHQNLRDKNPYTKLWKTFFLFKYFSRKLIKFVLPKCFNGTIFKKTPHKISFSSGTEINFQWYCKVQKSCQTPCTPIFFVENPVLGCCHHSLLHYTTLFNSYYFMLS